MTAVSKVPVAKVSNQSSRGGVFGWGLLMRDTLVYGTSAALSRSVGLLTFPVLTRYLAPENYGRLDLLLVVASLGTTILVMGQDSAVARLYYDPKLEKCRSQVVSQGLMVQVLAALALVLPVAWMLALLPADSTGARDFRNACALQAGSMPLVVVASFTANLLRWTFRRRTYVAITVGGAVLGGTGMLVGLWLGEGTLAAIVAGLFFASLASAGAGLWAVRSWLRFPREFGHFPELLRLGLPYMTISLLGAWMAGLERTLVVGLGSDEMLGAYAAGARIATVIMLPISAFQAAWGPFSLAIYAQPDSARTYSRVLRYLSFALVGISLSAHFFAAPTLVLLAGEEYLLGAVVVGPLMLGQAIRALGWIAGIGLDLAKRPLWVVPSQIVGAAVTVLCSVWGASEDLVSRVAWASLLGQAVSAAAIAYFGHRAWPAKIGWRIPALCSVLAACAMALSS